MKRKQVLAGALAFVLALGGITVPETTEAATGVVSEIPGTSRTFASYNPSFLSVTGFAKGHVNDRTSVIGTDKYRVVMNEEEFLQALDDAKTDKVEVIEIAADLDLGWDALSENAKNHGCIEKYGWSISVEITNPSIRESGVSQLTIANTKGLTIFSRAGNTVHHAEWKLQGSSSDIVIRNITFDGMWHWSEGASSKEAGWTLVKLNGVKGVWIDHCSFTLGADGNMDSENGASNMTASWCTYSLPADENPNSNSMLHKTITYMEEMYRAGKLKADERYSQLRSNGATLGQLKAYSAYHQKVSLNGSGDKDFKDSEGLEDGNQRIHLTLAYDKGTGIGSRFPLIRQGTAHLLNCYLDDSGHFALHNDRGLPFYQYGGYNLNWGADARNGACIGADTCVYKELQPMIGEEMHDETNGGANAGFVTAWIGVYNHNLIVNSRASLSGRTYEGSSWDNDGENLFTTGFTWKNKNTINNWSWFSSIKDSEKYIKGVPPTDGDGNQISFEFEYSKDGLPYAYQAIPLDEVETTIDKYAGSYVYNEGPEFWLRTEYSANETVVPAAGEVKATGVRLSYESVSVKEGEFRQIDGYVLPSHASNTELLWTSSNPSCAEVRDGGLIVAKASGTTVITATTKDGTKLSKTCTVTVTKPVESISIENAPKALNVGESQKLAVTVLPKDAENPELTWTSSNPSALSVDENGVITAHKKASNVRITCKAVDNSKISDSVRISVKEGSGTTNTPTPTETPKPTDTPTPTETPTPTDTPTPTETPEPTETPMPTDTPTPTATPEPAVLYGDVNQDGSITAEDALEILKAVVKLTTLDETKTKAAEVTNDGNVTAEDALEVLKKVVNLIEKFPVEEA